MEGRLLARAREEKEAQRTRNRSEENRRRAEVYEKLPEIQRIDSAVRGIMPELVALALGKKTRPAEEMERESLALQSRRAELLRQNGYSEDYLEPIFSCPRCRDTGYVNGKMCSCMELLYKKQQTRELSPLLGDGKQTFESFRLDYYSPVAPGNGQIAPRAKMEQILSLCRVYAETFGDHRENFLFTGKPGLGKTFLSAAIAKVVSEKGFSVAYDTAGGLLAYFEREKFSRDEDEQADASSRVRQLQSCDLLILDDLGTEMTTAFTQSALYSLIDGRLRAGKQTVISTNLNREAVEERYGSQLYSRLNGEYQWMEFVGRDIRAIRKEQL